MDESNTSCSKRIRKDLTAKRFGKLVVLAATDKRKNGSILWKCQCDCGNVCEKPTNELNSGFAVSCGCSWRQPAVHQGERFGKLTVIRPTKERSSKSVVWECICDCGNTTEVRATMLSSGHTTSCGCTKKEIDEQRDFKNILTYRDNTCIEFANKISEPRKTNSPDTGVRGVVMRAGKYQAQISFQKKRYYLGKYSCLEDAVEARRQAEEKVKEYIEYILQTDNSQMKFTEYIGG